MSRITYETHEIICEYTIFFCRGSSIRLLSSSSNTMDKKRTEHIILTAEKSRDPLVLGTMYK